MDEPCKIASEIDLGRFVLEPREAEWEGFRQHYPTCAACTAALAAWTKLEHRLRATDGTASPRHPPTEALVAYQRQTDGVPLVQRQTIAAHVRDVPGRSARLGGV